MKLCIDIYIFILDLNQGRNCILADTTGSPAVVVVYIYVYVCICIYKHIHDLIYIQI
jgi:hypothetical protein